MLHVWGAKHCYQFIEPHDAPLFPLQLVGLNNGGGAVHGPLWVPDLHSAKVAEFLDDASTKESQVYHIVH